MCVCVCVFLPFFPHQLVCHSVNLYRTLEFCRLSTFHCCTSKERDIQKEGAALKLCSSHWHPNIHPVNIHALCETTSQETRVPSSQLVHNKTSEPQCKNLSQSANQAPGLCDYRVCFGFVGYEMENAINLVAEMVEIFKTPLCLVIRGNVDGLYIV